MWKLHLHYLIITKVKFTFMEGEEELGIKAKFSNDGASI